MTPDSPAQAPLSDRGCMLAGSGTIDVAHLTTVHRWDDVRIFVKEARSAAAAGYRTVLLAPNAPTGVHDDVQMVSLPSYGSRAGRILCGVPAAAWRVLCLRPRLVHIHDPELFALTPLFRVAGIQVIVDLHEYLPTQIDVKHWIPSSFRRPVAIAAKLFLKLVEYSASTIVAATETIAGHFGSSRVVLLRNYPLLAEFSAEARPSESEGARFRVVYAGGISRARGAATMVQAIGEVTDDRIRLALAGRWIFPAERAAISELSGWARVDELGWIDRSAIRRLYHGAIAGVFVSEPNRHTQDSLPIKLFEYMAAGLPVVVADFPIWRKIVDDAGCGRVVPADAPAALAGAIDEFAADPDLGRRLGEAGRAAVLARYNWESERSRLLTAYSNLIGPPHGR